MDDEIIVVEEDVNVAEENEENTVKIPMVKSFTHSGAITFFERGVQNLDNQVNDFLKKEQPETHSVNVSSVYCGEEVHICMTVSYRQKG